MVLHFNLKNINNAAKAFLEATSSYHIFAINGSMGAGKTTFINAICNELHVVDTITSPTYSIINEYKTKTNKTIYHIDLYRLKNAQEAIQAGVEDCLFSTNVCFIEWANIAEDILPENTLQVKIEIEKNGDRKISS